MGYLRLNDYYNKRIQKTQLDQITGNRDAVRLSCELEAQAEVISYLVQKYDVNQEFTDTKVWTGATTYYANDRFEFDAPLYSDTSTYYVGQLAVYLGKVYKCITAINTPEVFNIWNWEPIEWQYTLYYLDTPYPTYNSQTYYQIGDIIYWNNKIYKCVTANIGVFPNDINNGVNYWGSGYSYSVISVQPYQSPSMFGEWNGWTTYNAGYVISRNGVLYQAVIQNTNIKPENSVTWQPIKWVNGDNRSQQLIGVMIDLCLAKIHNLIAPNNIPQVRKDNANYAIEWLKSAGGQNDAITADIPLLQPNQGLRIRYGSNVKNINIY